MSTLKDHLNDSTAPPRVIAAVHRDSSEEQLLTTAELARRWGCSQKKLAHDRISGRGVSFLAIGRLRRYALRDVRAYERAHYCSSTSDMGGRHDG